VNVAAQLLVTASTVWVRHINIIFAKPALCPVVTAWKYGEMLGSNGRVN
jgi:hypothetical protein